MANRRLHVALAALAALVCAIPAQAQDRVTPQRVQDALRDIGDHVAEVLITPTGKGRADYDLMTG